LLRRTFGPDRDEVAGGFEEFHKLYASANVITVIKEEEMGGWVS
jgi:hypothetical protein